MGYDGFATSEMRLMLTMILVVAAGMEATQDKPMQNHAPNHLAGSSSPYLLQHVHNPVDWYPWGAEAIERARREQKPIFLSVGYSTCYWCHVMEREVFENESIAKQMNDNFVCVKVDREERPDLDEIYMTATQLMSGHGGWPNSVFLTPELKPFFAGTYFGPEDQHGRPGFPSVIAQISNVWKTDRTRVESVAARMDAAIRSMLAEGRSGATVRNGDVSLDDQLVGRAVREIVDSLDPVDGGFGRAPKFPSDFYYSFLLDAKVDAAAAPSDRVRDAVTITLDAMAAGGIHDHVGGGFHRYSVDGQWHIPHFEKMLYNQALLATAYVDAYRATGDERYADAVRGILRFVAERFTGSEGQFFSALDAETDAVEGAYYAWTRDEIVAALGEASASAFLVLYKIVPIPTMPGHLHPEGGALVRIDRRAVVSPTERGWLEGLARVRATRKLPRLDDKSIASWNGMMIAAFAHASQFVHSDRMDASGGFPDAVYLDAARRGADFVLRRMRMPDGALVRSVRGDSTGSHAAFLEDYAWIVHGLLALRTAETDPARKAELLQQAVALEAMAESKFWDPEAGGFFVAEPQADLISRSKDFGDNATPSGNSVMAHNLLDLAQATGDVRYRERADELLRAFGPMLARMPRGAVFMVHALHRRLEDGQIASGAPRSDARLTSAARVKVAAPTTVAARPAIAQQGFEFNVELAIEAGWHINGPNADARGLIPTTVAVKCDDPRIEAISTELPAPIEQPSLVKGEPPLKVFVGGVTVSVRGSVNAALESGASILITIEIRYQACSDAGVCFAPSTSIVPITLNVR